MGFGMGWKNYAHVDEGDQRGQEARGDNGPLTKLAWTRRMSDSDEIGDATMESNHVGFKAYSKLATSPI